MSVIELAKTLDMPYEEWKEIRRQGIGGSDAAAILGLSPWKTAMDVWLEKTGEYVGDPEEEENERMYWGRRLEDIVAQEFEIRSGLRVRRKNAVLRSRQYPFMLANVDRLIVGQRAGLECKTTTQYNAEDWADGIPSYYVPQVQHYMAVLDYPLWYVAVLIGGQEFRYYAVQRNDEYIRELIKAETDFWRQVVEKVPPPLDGSPASSELMKRLYPEAVAGKEIELPFEAFELIQQYEEACREEKRILEIKEEAANKLKHMLGDAELGQIYDRQVVWKNVATKRLDTKALQAEFPEIYERFAKDTLYRRFAIK